MFLLEPSRKVASGETVGAYGYGCKYVGTPTNRGLSTVDRTAFGTPAVGVTKLPGQCSPRANSIQIREDTFFRCNTIGI